MSKCIVENDDNVCEACGTYAEVGYIIGEDDRDLVLEIDDVPLREKLMQLAKEQFEEVIIDDSDAAVLKMRFAYAAEKLIYELKLRELR